MRFCEQCGARFGEGASACERCGYRSADEPVAAGPAEPPPPPTGYAVRPTPAAGGPGRPDAGPDRAGGPPARPVAAPVPGPASPAALAKPGFPGAAVPPLVAALAFIVTTAYAIAYTLIEWGTLGDEVDVVFTAAAPSVLRLPFGDYESVESWLDNGPFGGGWTIAIPLILVVVLSAILLSRTNSGAGARLLVGSLVSLPLALFAGASMFIAIQLTEYPYFETGEMVLRAAGGGAIVGLLGGLLGGLFSLAIRPPPATGWPPRAY